MSEDAAPYRARRSEPAGEIVITPAEARELQNLYDRLPHASFAAAEALRSAAGGAPTGAALQRVRELHAYVATIVDRICEILGN
jgi:hypothetical protein